MQGSQYKFHQAAKMYQQGATFLVNYNYMCAEKWFQYQISFIFADQKTDAKICFE